MKVGNCSELMIKKCEFKFDYMEEQDDKESGLNYI